MLKCDIRKFFASVDQTILLGILTRHIPDKRNTNLISKVIASFRVDHPQSYAIAQIVDGCKKGLPLGNLTSQLLVNIYMNEFDQYAKHELKAKYYIRYADDFVILSHDREWLMQMGRYIDLFLRERLHLELHPDKVFIKTLASGVDFLGWVHFPGHRVLRTSTKRRMARNLVSDSNDARIQSYRGLLLHGNARGLAVQLQEAK